MNMYEKTSSDLSERIIQINGWKEDLLKSARLSANRWFTAFMGSSLIIILLVISLICVLPMKKLVPIVIHQNTKTGEAWVDKPDKTFVPETQAQTEADIVRYVSTRESYSAQDINQRFRLVMLLSNRQTAEQYADSQANVNKSAPVNVLGDKGFKTINVEDVVFIDKANLPQPEVKHFRQASSNLAKVDFTTETTDKTGTKHTDYWVATIGWTYKGLPESEQDAWDNWNGFTVTTYRVDPKNVGVNTP